MARRLELPDAAATEALGRLLAASLRPGLSLHLSGPIGAGKSSLARALIRQAAGDPALEVPSPTFTLVQSYETAIGEIWHVDLYRLSDPAEAVELGLEEAAAQAVLVIEWPDRLGSDWHSDRLEIALAAEKMGRCAEISAYGAEAQKILAAIDLNSLAPKAVGEDSPPQS